MKRFLSLMLALMMVLSTACFVSAEEAEQTIPDKVEISFKVGDSTLMINGNPVTVETPYVVGAGTTLVPLRVITEAFGAKVTWIGETKEIILEYPDVNITLQIGNVNATVNDHTEVLPEAPVLSPNGVTMVPLRFISETFGATVGYDAETAAITVVKENAAGDSTISSSTDLPRIGDSYYGWSMMTPSGMMMTDAASDGSAVVFEDEEAILIVEYFDLTDEEFGETGSDVFNERYKSVKSRYFAALTLSKDEKKADANGNGYFHIMGRNKENYLNYYSIMKDRTCVEICVLCPSGYEQIPSLDAVVNSFKFEFAADEAEKAQTYDLSTVDENGYRLVTDEDLKISFKVPADCLDADLDQLNIKYFVSGSLNSRTEITVGVYSKSETVSSKLLADKDRAHNAKYMNPELVNVSAVHPYTSSELGENAYYYWYTTKGVYGGNVEMYDIFFEKGDFVYNICIVVSAGDKEIFQVVTQSFVAEELNSAETGVFLRKEAPETTERTVSTTGWSMKVPGNWVTAIESTKEEGGFVSETTGAALLLQIMDADGIRHSNMQDLAEGYCDSLKVQGEVFKDVTQEYYGGTGYYTFTIYIEDDENDVAVFSTVYMTLINGKIYLFIATQEQIHANAGTQQEIISMITSFTAK